MKIYLADIFHDAADVYLNPGNCRNVETYSCLAIDKACKKSHDWAGYHGHYDMKDHVMVYVEQFGVIAHQTDQFRGVFTYDKKMRQGARYLWLKMLAEVAESESVYYDTQKRKLFNEGEYGTN